MHYIVYNGRKGGADAGGIHSYVYDDREGTLLWRKREDAIRCFCFLALSGDGRKLVAAGKDDQHEDILIGYEVDPRDGSLCRRGTVRTHTPGDICHLDINHRGDVVSVTDFLDKGIRFFALGEDGAPGDLLDRVAFEGHSTSFRQGSTHPHSAFFSLDDRWTFASDLGANRVWTVAREPGGRFYTAHGWKGKDGIGQRHVALHPNGRYVYSLCEITAEIAALELTSDGELKMISMYSAMDGPLPDYSGQEISDIGLPANYITAGDVIVSPDGRFVFASIRKTRQISVFSVLESGELRPVHFCESEGTVRCLKMGSDARTLFAFGEESSFTGGRGMIEVFRFDPDEGLLARAAQIDAPGTFIGAVLELGNGIKVVK